MLKERSPQRPLIDAEPLGHTGEIPHGLDGELGHGELARGVEADLSVGNQPSAPHAILELRQLHVGLGDGDGGAEVNYRKNQNEVSSRYEGDMPLSLSIMSLNSQGTMWPQGSMATIFFLSPHCGKGPMLTAGSVLVKSGT